MEIKDYIYHYVEEYFSVAVAFTICKENWGDGWALSDDDDDYLKYAQYFKFLYREFFDNGKISKTADISILEFLKQLRNSTINDYKNFVKDKLEKSLDDKVDKKKWAEISKELDDFIEKEYIDGSLLKKAREIEERI